MQNNQNKHEIVKQFIPKLLKVTDNYLTINENFNKTEISEVTDVLKNISDALDILISISYLFAKENVESNIENLTKLSNNITNINNKIDEQHSTTTVTATQLCKQILEKIDCLKYQIQLNQIINDRQTIGFTFDKPISKEEVRRILDGNN